MSTSRPHSDDLKQAEKLLGDLLGPLRPGLSLASCRLAGLSLDAGLPAGLLEFVAPSQRRFNLLLLPRREGSFWEGRSRHIHLRREDSGQGLPPESEAVLAAMTTLARHRDIPHGRDFVRALVPQSAEVHRPRQAVDNKVYLRITNACQFDCIFCNATEGLDSYYLEPEQVREALDQVDIPALNQVVFSGGEPTLSPHLPRYVRWARERGAKLVVVQTNGLKLAEAGYLDQFAELREAVGFGFSIHAASEAVNRVVTGLAGSLAVQLQALERTLQSGFGVLVTFVATRPALGELLDFLDLLAPHAGNPNLHPIHLAFPIPNGNAWVHRERMPTMSELIRHVPAMLKRGRALGLEVRMSESCALPPCLFHAAGIPEALDILDIYGDIPQINPTERRYTARCGDCGYRQNCAGIWRRYLDYLGEGEFVPVPYTEVRPLLAKGAGKGSETTGPGSPPGHETP